MTTERKHFLLGVLVVSTALAVLTGLCVGLWKAISVLSPQVAAAVLATSGTVLVSVGSLILSKRWEHKRDIEQEHRRQKLPIYEEFMAFWLGVIYAERLKGSPPTEQEMVAFFNKFAQKLILWSSDQVLKEFGNWRRETVLLSSGSGIDAFNSIMQFEKLLTAMRADLGHKDNRLSQGDLFAVFINDIDDYMKRRGAAA